MLFAFVAPVFVLYIEQSKYILSRSSPNGCAANENFCYMATMTSMMGLDPKKNLSKALLAVSNVPKLSRQRGVGYPRCFSIDKEKAKREKKDDKDKPKSDA